MSNIDKQALRERYSLQPVPKCHICDAVMTIARASAGAVVYACSGCTYDDNGAHYAPGRSLGDDHYSASRVTIFESGDSDVLELLDELEAKDKSIGFLKDQLAQLANFNPDWDRLEAAIDSLREHMAKLSAAEKRIAELEARTVCLPKLPVLGSNAEWYEGFAAGASGMRNECADAIRAAGIGVKGE